MKNYRTLQNLILVVLAALTLAACAPGAPAQWQDATIRPGAVVQTEYFGPSSWDIN